MNKHIFCAASLTFLLLSLTTTPVRAEVPLECFYSSGNETMNLAVGSVKNEIQRFSFTSKRGNTTCDVHSERYDPQSQWHDAMGKTAVTLMGGEVELEQHKNQIDVHFKNFRTGYYCGTGAALPGKVSLTRKSSECIVGADLERHPKKKQVR